MAFDRPVCRPGRIPGARRNRVPPQGQGARRCQAPRPSASLPAESRRARTSSPVSQHTSHSPTSASPLRIRDVPQHPGQPLRGADSEPRYRLTPQQLALVRETLLKTLLETLPETLLATLPDPLLRPFAHPFDQRHPHVLQCHLRSEPRTARHEPLGNLQHPVGQRPPQSGVLRAAQPVPQHLRHRDEIGRRTDSLQPDHRRHQIAARQIVFLRMPLVKHPVPLRWTVRAQLPFHGLDQFAHLLRRPPRRCAVVHHHRQHQRQQQPAGVRRPPLVTGELLVQKARVGKDAQRHPGVVP